MIEQTMIFALGFLVAGLAALAFAPAFWARAIRLTRRRLEMQIPLSIHEILAERDQLRAEFAVERCRLDQAAAHLAERHAADLAELGRRATQIGALQDELAARADALRVQEKALMATKAELTASEAELGAMTKALYDADGLRERKQQEFIDYVRLQEKMRLLGEMRFAALATADARIASLELQLSEVRRNLTETEQKLSQKDRHARSISEVLSETRQERETVENRVAALQDRLAGEMRRTAQLNEELAAVRAQHDADLAQLRTLTVKMSINDAVLEDARRREKDILTQRDLLAERARDAERALSDKYVHLRSEHAAVQGALKVARQRCEELESALASRRAKNGELSNNGELQNGGVSHSVANAAENAVLRQSISEIGAALIRLMQPNGEAASPADPHFAPPPVAPLRNAEAGEQHVVGHERATTP